MKEQELIDVWRAEFEEWFCGDLKVNLKRDQAGNYKFMNAQAAWKAWLAAKQSQPVVVLPMICFAEMRVNEVESVLILDDVKECLDAAGIKYVIKGHV